jgi:hypothetical protein
MRSTNSNHEKWYLVPMEPGMNATFRRWNIVIITILAFLVFGIFVAGIVPRLEGGTSAARKVTLKIDKNPAVASRTSRTDMPPSLIPRHRR